MKYPNLSQGTFDRPKDGLKNWQPSEANGIWQPSGLVGWRSNGGTGKGHPYRSLGLSLDIVPAVKSGLTRKIHIIGMFAEFANLEDEPEGSVGAMLTIHLQNRPAQRAPLVSDRHYSDSAILGISPMQPGDGTSLIEIGTIETNFGRRRVDVLTVELGHPGVIEKLRFTDLSTPASFVLFDVLFETTVSEGCPFSPSSPGLSFIDVAASVRVGDRVRFGKAYAQLNDSISMPFVDLDEARGYVMMFLAMLSAAMLEAGTAQPLHRAHLLAARRLDACQSISEVQAAARELVEEYAGELMTSNTITDSLINRALSYVDRSFAKDLCDADVAEIIGLSTSHFRFLFREATKQPFHKYLISKRLEKARVLLLEGKLSVTEVSENVGFHSVAHFSRAFTKRFQVAPSAIRQAHR